MAKNLILIVCCFILSGCATTQNNVNPDLQSLQSRIDFLEDELNAKDREIVSMRNELRKTVKENSRQKNSEISAKKVNKKAKSNGQDDDIIKVNGLTVSKVQAALKKAGFYNGNVDGKIGPKTKAAIKEFQRKNNLKVDGVVGRGTWAKLKKNI